MRENDFQLYKGEGDGATLAARNLHLPLFERPKSLDDPAGYIAEKGLRDAVNIALALGQPLLLTGEPGAGKTQLAASLAYELNLPAPLVFNVKTTSGAKDLFYRYDALGHFHDAQPQLGKQNVRIEDYISYEAFGLAVLLSQKPQEADPFLPGDLRGKGPTRSVVLIVEIDKAPRDLPNDESTRSRACRSRSKRPDGRSSRISDTGRYWF
jgi:MoxR-like ATPase